MKSAAAALRGLVSTFASVVGAEGAFLCLGTGLLAYGSSYFHPAAPSIVIGIVALLIGIALAVPSKRG
jgi:hypothetical protein